MDLNEFKREVAGYVSHWSTEMDSTNVCHLIDLGKQYAASERTRLHLLLERCEEAVGEYAHELEARAGEPTMLVTLLAAIRCELDLEEG